jgi:hypothetical protein
MHTRVPCFASITATQYPNTTQIGTGSNGIVQFRPPPLLHSRSLLCGCGFCVRIKCDCYAERKRGAGTASDITPPPQTALQAEESTKTEEHKILTLLDVIPECVGAEVKSVFYKSKIRVILRNDTEKTIEVRVFIGLLGPMNLHAKSRSRQPCR